MKFLKSTIAMVAVLAIGSVGAKQVGKKTTTTPITTVTTSTKQAPSSFDFIFEQYNEGAKNIIKNMLNSIVKLQENFTTDFFNTLNISTLSPEQKMLLLDRAKEAMETVTNINLHKKEQEIIIQKIDIIKNNFTIKYDAAMATLEKQGNQ